MSEIVRLRDDAHLLWDNVYPRIEEFIATLENRPIRTIAAQQHDRTKTWRKMYKYEVAYRYLKLTDPNHIPPKDIIEEAARQHKRQLTDSNRFNKKHPLQSVIEVISPEELMDLYRSRL
jgi:hypothetical protein